MVETMVSALKALISGQMSQRKILYICIFLKAVVSLTESFRKLTQIFQISWENES